MLFLPLTLTAEGAIPPGSDVHPAVLAFIDVGFYGFTQNGLGSIQRTQVKDTVLEVILKTHIRFVALQCFILSLCFQPQILISVSLVFWVFIFIVVLVFYYM